MDTQAPIPFPVPSQAPGQATGQATGRPLPEAPAVTATELPIRCVRLPYALSLPPPAYQTAGAAGMDLHAAISAVLHPGVPVAVPTGVKLEIPEGYEGQVRSRGSLAAKGIAIANAPGTVDADYRGEILVILINLTPHALAIAKKDRIAQMVIAPVMRARLMCVTETLDPTERDEGRLGSTGA